MPRSQRPSYAVTFRLTGDRAEALADRLLSGRSDVLDIVWDELTTRAGRGVPTTSRLRHDWDPAARTFTLEARAGVA